MHTNVIVAPIRLSSKDRHGDSKMNDARFFIPSVTNVVAYMPKLFTLNNSWPEVNSNNNLLTLSYVGAPGTTSILIPQGNYTAQTFLDTVAAGITGLASVPYSNFTTPTWQSIDGGGTFSQSGGAAIQFLWSLSTASKFFGFKKSSANSQTPFRSGLINVYSTNCIQLQSNSFNPDFVIASSQSLNTCFAHLVTSNTVKYADIVYENVSPSDFNWIRWNSPRQLSDIQIQIKDSDGNLIPLSETSPEWTLIMWVLIKKV